MKREQSFGGGERKQMKGQSRRGPAGRWPRTHVGSGEKRLLQQGAREAAAQGQREGRPGPEELQACPLQALVEFTVAGHEVRGPPGRSQERADLRRWEIAAQGPPSSLGPARTSAPLPTCSCTTLSQHCVMFLRLLLGRAGGGPGLRSRALLLLLAADTEGKGTGSSQPLGESQRPGNLAPGRPMAKQKGRIKLRREEPDRTAAQLLHSAGHGRDSRGRAEGSGEGPGGGSTCTSKWQRRRTREAKDAARPRGFRELSLCSKY